MTTELAQQPAGTDLATAPQDPQTLKSLLSSEAVQAAIKDQAAGHFTPMRVTKMALMAVSRQPKLLQCTTKSLLGAMIQSAELGLNFAGGPTGEAYLVPYKQTAQLIVGYRGLKELALRSGKVTYVQAFIVHENDVFKYELGTEPKIRHEPVLTNRGKPVAAYAVARFVGGAVPIFVVMNIDEVNAIRKRSQAANSGPWVTDFEEMAKKTAFRNLAKWLPMSTELEQAQEYDADRLPINGEAPAIVDMPDNKRRLGVGVKGDNAKPAPEPEPAPTNKALTATKKGLHGIWIELNELQRATVLGAYEDVDKIEDLLDTEDANELNDIKQAMMDAKGG